MTDRRKFLAAAGVLAATALPAPAIATEKRHRVRMVTSWPKNMPGPGISAELLAAHVRTLSGGRLEVKVHAVGELVSALGVFDAVAGGAVEMAHTASLFWGGKLPAAPLFTAGPFGLPPVEHAAWLDNGGGQTLWEELYAPFGVMPMMAGNTGPSMGGWFRKAVLTTEDFKGVKMRMPGLGGEIIRRLGATPVTLPPGEILPALLSGTIDAAEFLGPFSDMAMGFHKVAKVYHYPAFHEPNGAGELIVSKAFWNSLDDDLKKVIRIAARSEAQRTFAEHTWRNARALRQLQKDHGVQVLPYPHALLAQARQVADEVLANLAAKDSMSRRIVESWQAARSHLAQWSDISQRAFLAARNA